MEYRDRALAAAEAAEQSLRAQLKVIILEAINAEDYGDVAAIARMTGALHRFVQGVRTDKYTAEPGPQVSLDDIFGPSQPSPELAPNGSATTATQKLPSPGSSSQRQQYPQFLRDGERLVKIAWSKKDRAPYEHRAPRAVIEAFVAAVQKKKGEGKMFQAAEVMPIKNGQFEEYPSYQSYIALNWLREVGVISKKGREGYVLKTKSATAEKLAQLWTTLPVFESND